MSAFDQLAAQYDERWTNTPAGRSQRSAVWRQIDPLFHSGDNVLDLGCGTGEDAVHLAESGVCVRAIDASSEMVHAARSRGVDATVLSLEDLSCIKQTFDGALSNFGALNCVHHLSPLRQPLGRMVRPGGHLAICVIGRFCLWETLWFALHGELRKAARRWSGSTTSASLGLRVFYPSPRHIRSALAPEFRLVRVTGVGAFVPPSFVTGFSRRTVARFEAIDRRIAHLPGIRALCDHRLLIFQRRHR